MHLLVEVAREHAVAAVASAVTLGLAVVTGVGELILAVEVPDGVIVALFSSMVLFGAWIVTMIYRNQGATDRLRDSLDELEARQAATATVQARTAEVIAQVQLDQVRTTTLLDEMRRDHDERLRSGGH